jgi:hypothetical protein
MDWRIPEKLKKGVSYARFSTTLYLGGDFVKLDAASGFG